MMIARKSLPWIPGILTAAGALACFGMSNNTVVLSGAAPAPSGSSAARPVLPAEPGRYWLERFDGANLAWVAPIGGSGGKVSKVFSVQREDGVTFLHGRHDGRPDADKVGFVHYGKRFDPQGPPLERVRSLRWKWRVRQHPANTTNMWEDVAASVYVIVKPPSVLGGGKGFRFGWLGGPGVKGTYRMGLGRVSLREDPATMEWKSEAVDVCALYREWFGPCEGERLNYVGVATEADGTDSVSEADYTDFELIVEQ